MKLGSWHSELVAQAGSDAGHADGMPPSEMLLSPKGMTDTVGPDNRCQLPRHRMQTALAGPGHPLSLAIENP
jgi:hypothetical protein